MSVFALVLVLDIFVLILAASMTRDADLPVWIRVIAASAAVSAAILGVRSVALLYRAT